MQKKVRKAVIPVAGYGTRFLPFTKAVPKPMLPILNKPALQVISEEVVNSGITDILFIVGYKKEILESHFDAAPRRKYRRVGGQLRGHGGKRAA